MKRIKILLLAVLFVGCQKDKICNCGTVVSDNGMNMSVDIKNSCSGNIKTFYLNATDWINAVVGSEYCINNVDNW